MNYIKLFVLFLFANLFTSFSKLSDAKLIDKIWVYDNYDFKNDIVTFRKKNHFANNRKCFQFSQNGHLKVKQNSSWCSNPPIIFEIVEGTWNKKSDSIIILNYKRWGEDYIQQVKILKLTNRTLEMLMPD